MKTIYGIEFYTGSREELLPNFTADFPYIASRVELDKSAGRFVPWHWHKTVELFYIEAGTLAYNTPKGKFIFPTGSGGMVNSNMLHMTKPCAEHAKTIQLLHIFDTALIAGEQGNRMEQKYIMPIVTASQLELVALHPGNPQHETVLTLIQEAFYLSEQAFGYELKLREILSEIWLSIYRISDSVLKKVNQQDKTNEKIKMMMVYIHEHYAEKISVSALAATAFLSERACFRVFRDCLHMTPVEYIKNYRLQIACRMLAKGKEPITSISLACGLGSSSYFGKLFREAVGCTPMQYRLKWQDSDR